MARTPVGRAAVVMSTACLTLAPCPLDQLGRYGVNDDFDVTAAEWSGHV